MVLLSQLAQVGSAVVRRLFGFIESWLNLVEYVCLGLDSVACLPNVLHHGNLLHH